MADQPYDEFEAPQGGELNDRLHHLAREAEPLVVLAGPQAVRARGERRRARRRAGAAAVVAALALGVGSWQLLPRLDSGGGTRTAPPAASTAPDPEASANALLDRLTAELLPTSSLPFPVKWQWTVAPEEEGRKFPLACGVPTPEGATAKVFGYYHSVRVNANAREDVFAFPDAATAAGQARKLVKEIATKCEMSLAVSHWDAGGMKGGAEAYSGASKLHIGVAVWVQYEGPYVAVLAINSPRSPLLTEGEVADEPQPRECISASLDRLAFDAPSADTTSGQTGHGSATAGTSATAETSTGSALAKRSPTNC